ncbi:MAG: hypothetical protein K2W95_24835 [Candidatus Obscuribacterales bacterium]|nr:hypothetical protein [Candidatus Obscuribacterales bacterium]
MPGIAVIRLAVARNRHTHPADLARLAQDSDVEVRQECFDDIGEIWKTRP